MFENVGVYVQLGWDGFNWKQTIVDKRILSIP